MKMLRSVCAALLAAATPVSAQVYMPTFENSTLLLDVYSYTYNTGKSARPSRSTRPPAADLDTRYRPSPDIAQRVQQRFIQFIGQHSGEAGEAEMAAVLKRQDPTATWLSIVGKDGLKADDLTDSIAAYWLLNWNIANQTDSDRAQMMGVRGQLARSLAANPAIAKLNESARQEMSETLILNFLVQHAAFRDAAQTGNRELMRKLSDAAVARFRNEARLDLRAMNATPKGFVPRK